MPLVESTRCAEWFLSSSVDPSKDRRTITGFEQKSHGGKILRDGFQELFHFQKHALSVRGVGSLVHREEINEKNKGQIANWRNEFFVSWDRKNAFVWQHNRLLKTFRFPASAPHYLTTITFLQRLNIFLTTTSDFCFNLYDKSFHLLEIIKHEERAILSMEQDHDAGLVVTAGATGVSVWRVYRNLSLDMTHVIEKMYTFAESPTWVTKIIYDSSTQGKVFATVERSVYVFDINSRRYISYDLHM